MNRPLVKSAYQKINFLISQPKHILWVLKRTLSMRRFFWALITYVHTDDLENIYNFMLKKFIYLNLCMEKVLMSTYNITWIRIKKLICITYSRYFEKKSLFKKIAFLTDNICSGLKVIKLFSCSTQLSTKFQLLIKTKIPTNEEVSCFKSLRLCIYHAHKC